jgi:hypothetical protein
MESEQKLPSSAGFYSDPKYSHPLMHGLMGQDIIHQQSGAVGHSSCPATGAKTAAFTTERHQLLIMASLTPDPEKAMLQPAAFQVGLKFLYNVGG